MKQEEQQAIALAKYAAIAPLVTDQANEYQKRGDFYIAASKKGVRYPDGTLRHPAAGTIQKWYLDYLKGGFDSLLPQVRSDFGKSRVLDDEAKEKISYYHEKYPRMSAAAIHKQLLDDGTFAYGRCSESTVLRYINQLDLEARMSAGKDMRRYERAHINEVWYGDSSAGPWLKGEDGRKRRVTIVALIDDASRYVVGANLFCNDNFENLMSVIDHVEYEVDCRYAKQRIRLRYAPDMEEIYLVEADGSLSEIRLLNKSENASVKREKAYLSRGEEE